MTMRDELIGKLLELPWKVTLNGPTDALRHPGNINVRFQGFSAHEILTCLQPYLAASTRAACSSGIPEPSHVLKAIGLSSEDAEASIRFSIGRHTTVKELQRAIHHIRDALEMIDASR
jgi:cysteine desulfurase